MFILVLNIICCKKSFRLVVSTIFCISIVSACATQDVSTGLYGQSQHTGTVTTYRVVPLKTDANDANFKPRFSSLRSKDDVEGLIHVIRMANRVLTRQRWRTDTQCTIRNNHWRSCARCTLSIPVSPAPSI